MVSVVESEKWQEMHVLPGHLPLRRKWRPPGQAGDSNRDCQRTSTRADRHALQQRTAATAPRWRGLGHACEARVNAGGYFPVNLFQERCDYRVAVFGAQFAVRRSGGADVLWGYR
jgi:hypothetical protein